VDGAPVGTRGGIVVDHIFPPDGFYVFKGLFRAGDVEFEELDLSIDGERVALMYLEILHTNPDGPRWEQETELIFIRAGQRRVAAAFIRKTDGTYDDIIQPYGLSENGTSYGRNYGITLLTHLRQMNIRGPDNPTGVSETVARQNIFSCRSTSPEQAVPCVREILTRLTTEAYRRPPNERDVEGLLGFYERGAAEGGFEFGIRSALEAPCLTRALFAAFLVVLPGLSAQTVTGRVIDQSSGQPLTSVYVFVAGSGIGSLTQQNGRYTCS